MTISDSDAVRAFQRKMYGRIIAGSLLAPISSERWGPFTLIARSDQQLSGTALPPGGKGGVSNRSQFYEKNGVFHVKHAACFEAILPEDVDYVVFFASPR